MTFKTKYNPGDRIWVAHLMDRNIKEYEIETIEISYSRANKITHIQYTCAGACVEESREGKNWGKTKEAALKCFTPPEVMSLDYSTSLPPVTTAKDLGDEFSKFFNHESPTGRSGALKPIMTAKELADKYESIFEDADDLPTIEDIEEAKRAGAASAKNLVKALKPKQNELSDLADSL